MGDRCVSHYVSLYDWRLHKNICTKRLHCWCCVHTPRRSQHSTKSRTQATRMLHHHLNCGCPPARLQPNPPIRGFPLMKFFQPPAPFSSPPPVFKLRRKFPIYWKHLICRITSHSHLLPARKCQSQSHMFTINFILLQYSSFFLFFPLISPDWNNP